MEANVIAADVCGARMSMHAERFRRDKERLDKFEESIAKLNEATALLTQMVAIHSETQKEHTKRIAFLENRPAAWWDRLIGGVIGALSGGFAAALVSLVVK
ncbi:MAG: hypothetical protein LBS36_05185 [Oscillospiraceae bacterium]|jgi:hypothetical protein|nr:hypothetical protein [Oscillospiraceae bacterium]